MSDGSDAAYKKDTDFVPAVPTYATASPIVYGQPSNQTAYGNQTTYANQPTYASQSVVNSQPLSTGQTAFPVTNTVGRVKPVNRWSDGICDWFKNLYPSCYCACCVCYGIYIVAQMSQKTGFAKFSTIIGAYAVIYLVSIIITAATGSTVIIWLPMIFAFLCQLALRLYVVRKENITECGSSPLIGEFCCGIWCWYCSVAQMARHLYGYTKTLDGDGDPDRPDGYTPSQV